MEGGRSWDRGGSEEWKQRISAGLRRHHQRRREYQRVNPRDLTLIRSGKVTASLRPLLPVAEAEMAELLEACGGESISPQRRAILEDAVRLGLVLRAELLRYAQTQDPDSASRVSTLANARRASLSAVGLDRFAKDVDLRAYLAAKGTEKSRETVEDVTKSTIDTESESSLRRRWRTPCRGRCGECLMTIIDTMQDPQLFGRFFNPMDPWSTWVVILKALFALALG
jgi:hypothetical protein